MKPDAREILDTLLGYLGFSCEIRESEHDGLTTLQIYTGERQALIGRHGETLDDIQYLVNRIAQGKDFHGPRVQVDVEHYREMRDDALVQKTLKMAEVVRITGRPFHLEPMNAYDRRLIHTAFKDDPQVTTYSPPDDARLKRITLQRRTAS